MIINLVDSKKTQAFFKKLNLHIFIFFFNEITCPLCPPLAFYTVPYRIGMFKIKSFVCS